MSDELKQHIIIKAQSLSRQHDELKTSIEEQKLRCRKIDIEFKAIVLYLYTEYQITESMILKWQV